MNKTLLIFLKVLALVAAGTAGPSKNLEESKADLTNAIDEILDMSNKIVGVLVHEQQLDVNIWNDSQLNLCLQEMQESVGTLNIQDNNSTILLPFSHTVQALDKLIKQLMNNDGDTVVFYLLTANVKQLRHGLELYREANLANDADYNIDANFTRTVKGTLAFLQKLYKILSSPLKVLSDTAKILSDTHNVMETFEGIFGMNRFNNDVQRRVFQNLIYKYFDDFHNCAIPEITLHPQNITMDNIETQFSDLVELIILEVPKLSQESYHKLVRITKTFETQLRTISKTNTRLRQLGFRIRALAESISSAYGALPLNVREDTILEHSQRFLERLKRIFVKIEKTNGVEDDTVKDWNATISDLSLNLNLFGLIRFIPKSSYATNKLLINLKNQQQVAVDFANRFLDALEFQAELVTQLSGSLYDADFWAIYLTATTNKLGMCTYNKRYPEDVKTATKTLSEILKLMESNDSEEFQYTIQQLKRLVKEFEDKKEAVDTFLQKVSLQLKKLVRTFAKAPEGLSSHKVVKILQLFVQMVEEISIQNKIVDALSPVHTQFVVDSVADQLSDMIHITIAKFNNGHYLYQVLESTTLRLEEVESEEIPVDLVYSVLYNLRRIQSNLKQDLDRSDPHLRIKMAMYVQEAAMELRRLLLSNSVENGLQGVYGEIVYGTKALLTQIQWDFQVTTEESDVKMLITNIQSVFERMLMLLHRTGLKPELKEELITYLNHLSFQIDSMAIIFGEIESTVELSSKYRKMHNELQRFITISEKEPIERICNFVDTTVSEIVLDLESVVSSCSDAECSVRLYGNILITFSTIMTRLQSVHKYEYYYSTINAENFGDIIQNLTMRILNNLRMHGEEYMDDLIRRYIRSVEKMMVQLQIDPSISLKQLLQLIFNMADRNKVSDLANYIQEFTNQVQFIWKEQNNFSVREVLISYIVAAEELCIRTQRLPWNRSVDITSRFQNNVQNLMTTLELIEPVNLASVDVLRTLSHQQLRLVSSISLFIHQGSTIIFQNVISKISSCDYVVTENLNQVDKLKVEISVYAQHLSFVLRKLSLAMGQYHNEQQSPEPLSASTKLLEYYSEFNSWFYKFASLLQDMDKALITVLFKQVDHHFNIFNVKSGRFKRQTIEVPNEPIEQSALEVAKDVREISSYRYEIKRELLLLIRKLIETLIQVLDNLDELKDGALNSAETIKALRQVKKNLQEVLTSNVFYTTIEMKNQISNAIEKVAIEMKAVTAAESVSKPFDRYLSETKDRIKNIIPRYELESYRNQNDPSKKPLAYMQRVLRIPTLRDFKLGEI